MSSVVDEVVQFYLDLGFSLNDLTAIGIRTSVDPRDKVSDIPRFYGRKDVYICIHPFIIRRKKENIQRIFTCYGDLDFKNYDRAMCEIPNVQYILDDYELYYGVVHSGRGLHIYVPIGDVDETTFVQLNKHLNTMILREYFQDHIVDRKPIRNYATLLRLPNTINSKNNKRTFIAYHNFNAEIDYFSHNRKVLMDDYIHWERKVPVHI